ncbi:MAG: alpha/beta hydrolase [Aquaticitalea sp.]
MTIDYKGIQIYFNDVGTGDCVLLLHGFLENLTMWDNLVPHICKTHRVISIDLLGHGKTGCLEHIHTMEMMAEAVHAVLEHFKIEKTIIIGHSMGGYAALAFAELYPNKMSGLCLMNSTALPDSEERQINRERAIMAVKQNHKTFISMSVSNLFAPENRVILKKEINHVKNESLKMSVQGIIAALKGMKMRKNRELILHNTSYKKMMIIGQKDPVLDYDNLIQQTNGTKVELVQLTDGHMSHIENLKELTYYLLHFIEK